MIYEHILVASGGAPHSQLAEQRAVELAKVLQAQLSLATVIRDTAPTSLAYATGAEGFHVSHVSELEQEQERVLREAVARCERHGVKPSGNMLRGNAGKRIVACAKELGCDLIVVGSRKLSMIGAIAQGSVSDYVMRHAECHVLIVR